MNSSLLGLEKKKIHEFESIRRLVNLLQPLLIFKKVYNYDRKYVYLSSHGMLSSAL